MDKLTWKPHEKSMSLGSLSKHIAELPHLIALGMKEKEWEISTHKPTPLPTSNSELLALFDSHYNEALDALKKDVTSEYLAEPWSMRNKETIFFTLPRFAVVRSMGFNHLVHHRGQLTVYLRLLNIPLPGIYGPSADER